MSYDVVLIHPPAFYDFRKQPLFPGPLGPSVEKVQFIKVPLGMICIANYLDRHGVKVIIDNIAERMVADREFDVEKHIKNLESGIYAIDLHWHHHAQGAIELARLCKRLHPQALVVLGGLTATYYHEEIIQKYDFIDAVIRGEGEKALLAFAEEFAKTGKVPQTSNVTCRGEDGKIRVIPMMEGSADLDEFEYTRFDLIEPKTTIFNHGGETFGNLVTCRGCIYNCVTCGGSSYNYRKYFGLKKPAVRSPRRIVEDIKSFNEQGITLINLYQDARMGGEKYWRELFTALRDEKDNLKIDRLSLDIFAPVDEEFAREVSSIGKPVMLYMTPESGDAGVRKIQGRCYSNEEIINTVKVCQKYHLPITFFFSVGLSGENSETFKATKELWDKLCMLDSIGIARHMYGGAEATMGGPIVGPIILEPGSAAFDDPQKYGYKLRFGSLEEYIAALSQPSWHQWLNHETDELSRDALVELILESVVYSISEREKYGAYDNRQAYEKQSQVNTDRIAVGEVEKIMHIADEAERRAKLKALRETIDSYLRSHSMGRG
jgi:B12-binding domain/radical SAM domain protein